MPAIKYKVNLTEAEKLNLEALLHKGKSAVRSQTRARILLKAASGCQDKAIMEALNVSLSMVAKAPSAVCGRGLGSGAKRPSSSRQSAQADR
jgi:hypothetical protein